MLTISSSILVIDRPFWVILKNLSDIKLSNISIKLLIGSNITLRSFSALIDLSITFLVILIDSIEEKT